MDEGTAVILETKVFGIGKCVSLWGKGEDMGWRDFFKPSE